MKNKKIKIQHLWTLLCSASTIDTATNNLSVTNIIEELSLERSSEFDKLSEKEKADFKVVLPVNFQLINLWRRAEGEGVTDYKVKIDFIDPKGEILNSLDLDMNFPSDKKRMRQRINIQSLPVSVAGDYSFNIFAKYEGNNEFEAIYSMPLVINIIPMSQQK